MKLSQEMVMKIRKSRIFLDVECIILLNNKFDGGNVRIINIKKNIKRKFVEKKYENHNL